MLASQNPPVPGSAALIRTGGITSVIFLRMKTAISIPDDLFEKAEELAERLEVSRSQLYARAISEYTARHSSQQVREKLDELYAEVEASLDPVLGRMQSISLPEKW